MERYARRNRCMDKVNLALDKLVLLNRRRKEIATAAKIGIEIP
jgi:hypothetical protein